MRERERRAFRTGTYWDLKAQLAPRSGQEFEAELVPVGGERIATGKDFDETTGKLTAGSDVVLLDEAAAGALRDRLLKSKPWRVTGTEEKPSIRRPVRAVHHLHAAAGSQPQAAALGAATPCGSAQSLYERGFITYMRTDSVHLSEQAITAARSAVHATLRRGVPAGRAPALCQQERQRAGSARGDPPRRRVLPQRRARPGSTAASWRSTT